MVRAADMKPLNSSPALSVIVNIVRKYNSETPGLSKKKQTSFQAFYLSVNWQFNTAPRCLRSKAMNGFSLHFLLNHFSSTYSGT